MASSDTPVHAFPRSTTGTLLSSIDEPREGPDEEHLRQFFKAADTSGDGVICMEEFEQVMLKDLQLDLSCSEVERVFAALDVGHHKKINFEQFALAVRQHAFLTNIVGSYSAAATFAVAADYDYSKPTSEIYKADHREFFGEFAAIRKNLDYEYHNNYTEQRQLWQDEIIRQVVVRTHPQPKPWITYTAGPMGAGKGYTMAWLSRNGIFPLENIVRIDPDYFKRIMPEWEGYLKFNQEDAGTLCHLESGMMQEIAQEVALSYYQNIWVDGSLKNGKWFAKSFKDLRRRYPMYRISIFYIYAEEERVRFRIARRASVTGRTIPEKEIQKSLEAGDKSLKILTPHVDFVARINNDSSLPVLDAFEMIDHSGSWDVLRSRFAQVGSTPGEFPSSMAPLYLQRTDLVNEDFTLPSIEQLQNPPKHGLEALLHKSLLEDPKYAAFLSLLDRLTLEAEGKEPHGAFRHRRRESGWHLRQAKAKAGVSLKISPAHPVNLGPAAREEALIPAHAQDFVFCYPLDHYEISVAELEANDVDLSDSLILLLIFGGFIYIGLEGEVAVNAITPERRPTMLQFNGSEELTCGDSELSGRWMAVTIPHMCAKGAREFAWVLPGERVGGKRQSKHGAFIYRFADGTVRIYSVLG